MSFLEFSQKSTLFEKINYSMFHYSLRVIDEPKNERNSNFELVPQKVDFGRQLQTVALTHSLLKQNIKSCNAKRRRQRRRTAKSNNRSNQQKSNFSRATHFFSTFLCRCLALLQRKTSRNLLVIRFMEEMPYTFSFTFIFTAARFHLAQVAASISHLVTTATKFSCCSSNKTKKSPLLFICHIDLCRPFSH